VKGCCVDMGVSGLRRYVTGAHAATSANVHAVGFRENHRLSPMIKCAEKILYIYV
jgi:hypothetical protein